MHKLQLSVLLAILCLALVSVPLSTSVSKAVSKRQTADADTASYLAWMSLGGKVTSPDQECTTVACGVVDVHKSGKKKRDSQDGYVSDEERYNLLKSLIQRAALENSS